MKKIKIFVMCFLVFSLGIVVQTSVVWAPEEYKISPMDLKATKKMLDDPRPWVEAFSPQKTIPPEVYSKMTFNIEEMKKLWSELVGFKATDEVGKIAPEIKPGTYSYKDKEKYPGLKELMIPKMYERFKAGGPPLFGVFPEIKVVPTKQYYFSLPIAEATKKNTDHTKLNNKGLMIEDSYVSGYPFPRPSGPFKANQIIYNWLKNYCGFESEYSGQLYKAFNRHLAEDQNLVCHAWRLRLQGRVAIEPYGWFDKRAQEQGERKVFTFKYDSPRDLYGNVILVLHYLAPEKYDLLLAYINVLRRIRKLSSTDIQDTVGGADGIYADDEIYSQKLSDKVFPYKCEVVAEREYLYPFEIGDGSAYFSSNGEMRGYEWQRRPMYVVKMTQLDKGFVYSYRMVYIDKETFTCLYVENYDQKGRLYRTGTTITMFYPKMGIMIQNSDWVLRDELDLHSTIGRAPWIPSPWITREHVNLQAISTKEK